VRIISGIYKGRRFDVPKSFKARPTTDFAKENLFNVLTNIIDLECVAALDLFSGTGSIAFELASRGCSKVVAVEKDFAHYSFIKTVREKLHAETLQTVRTDAFRFIATTNSKFDMVFADPPYSMKTLPLIPEQIFEHNILNPNGIFVLEHPKEYSFASFPQFIQKRIYGSVNFSIFKNQSDL